MDSSLNSDDIVDIGEKHHRAGRLQDAESCYRKALEIDPGHPGALYGLASIACDDDRLQFATQLLDELLQGEPNDAEAWYLLGVIALKEENVARAIECLRRAVTLQPNYIQAHYSLGVALGGCGELDAALESFQRVAALNPGLADVHFAIGSILQTQKKFDAALSSYQKAISENSRHESTYLCIGQILRVQNKLDEAIASYRQALAKLPNAVLIYQDLGTALLESKQYSDAMLSLERAISLDPNCAEAHRGIGVILLEAGKMHEAVIAFKRLVALTPQSPRPWMHLADAFSRMSKLAEAIDSWRQAIAIDPNHVRAHQLILTYSHTLPAYSREQSFADHVAFGERFEAPWREKWPKHSKPINPQKRLRVGFVSGDLRNHPVGHFLEGVLRELRKLDGVDIVVYSTNADVDEITDQIRTATHSWVPVFALSDDAFEQCIREDAIDILVDLSGHTSNNRLLVFARKPAPIQVTWLGYWETTGLRSIDYILCDRNSVRDDVGYFVEEPWYLPHTRLCFTLPDESIEVAPLPALNNGYVTFACCNNLIKLNDRVVSVWSHILRRIPNARLLLKGVSLGDSNIREETAARFAAEGISADRLELQQVTPLREYYLTYHRVDIALDPFPFPGGTTSVQGIWMGVPMITLRGDRMIYRQGESVLHNIGLHDWIAKDEDEYIELAVQKAGDLTGLAELRRELRGKLESSPLCDAKSFAQNLENAFRQMWGRFALSVS